MLVLHERFPVFVVEVVEVWQHGDHLQVGGQLDQLAVRVAIRVRVLERSERQFNGILIGFQWLEKLVGG